MVVKYLFFCFIVIVLFLSFLSERDLEKRPASENGHKIVSHGEQSCSVQKNKLMPLRFVAFVLCCLVLPRAFSFVGGSVLVSLQ